MTSTQPYLLRAFYEWIVDNELTPQIVVNAEMDNVDVPLEFVNEGKIVLNISMTATQGLEMTNEWLSFSARFSGKPTSVYLPMASILAIYARENGQGITFQAENLEQTQVANAEKPTATPKPKRPPYLRLVD